MKRPHPGCNEHPYITCLRQDSCIPVTGMIFSHSRGTSLYRVSVYVRSGIWGPYISLCLVHYICFVLATFFPSFLLNYGVIGEVTEIK